MKKMILMASIVLLVGTLLASQAVAASWYRVKIVSTITKADGSVALQFEPGASENRFAGIGKAKIAGNVLGINKMLATILTSVSMDSEVTLFLDGTPSGVMQDLLAVNLLSTN